MRSSKSKYKNVRTKVDGFSFDSKREAARFIDLRMMLKAGTISQLKIHPSFKLEVNGAKICSYEADFTYMRDGKQIIEDVKGVLTSVYRIKKKLMLAIHGIAIVEVR